MKVSLSTTVLAAALAGSALAAPSGAGAQRQANVEASQAGAGASVSLAQADAQELLRIAIKLNQQGTENEQTRHAKRDLEMHPKGKKFNRVSKDVSKDGQ
ncbi:hypothetical protein G6O67_004421 [Ophiocordyceps sinensis]|uniref:Uncharacterized protein n=1 Tax=Ophiocordyceps sinensis TaxID=72228 RepID=A0A8H4PNN7_9HYPO|nr:hypothetical protein G6O67_004421 [Ophiocordyceps sinensis]